MTQTTSLARRVLLCFAAFTLLQVAYAATHTTPPPQVRLKWQDFVSGSDGAKRLASLEKAVAKMKSLDGSPKDSADFRRSWLYWANIHGYLGTGSPFHDLAWQIARLNKPQTPPMSQFVPYLKETTDQTPPDDVAKAIWATCQHSPPGKQLNFFGWHRMYLYYFERVLRWASQDDTLRLPYWDYTDIAQTGLPVEFQDPKSPLYDWRRSEALNEGLALLDPHLTDIDGPLTTDKDFLSYEGDIEGGVHGNVHCSVGQTCPVAVMGLVAIAANDPIFYEHHANIDRMWSCWQQAHPDEQPGDWQNQQFSFVDETGSKVTGTVKDFLDTTALGYVYDNASQCARNPALKTVALQNQAATSLTAEQRWPNVVTASKRISLNPSTTSVNLAVPAAKRRSFAATETQSVVATALVLRDVTAQSSPGALVDVYIAKKGAPATRQYVATINWFGVFDHMDGTDHPEGPSTRTFQYDVTRQLSALGLTNASGLTVTFEVSSGLVPSNKRPTTPSAAAAIPKGSIRPEAKVTVGAIELRQ
jgi:Common central domain of tyrosinase/Polyphenol oxidase middle domain